MYNTQLKGRAIQLIDMHGRLVKVSATESIPCHRFLFLPPPLPLHSGPLTYLLWLLLLTVAHTSTKRIILKTSTQNRQLFTLFSIYDASRVYCRSFWNIHNRKSAKNSINPQIKYQNILSAQFYLTTSRQLALCVHRNQVREKLQITAAA